MPLQIQFNRSPDDGAGENDVDHYSIRYSTENDPPLTGDEIIQVEATGAASYSHTHNAHVNGAEAFVSVVAVDAAGQSSAALSGSISSGGSGIALTYSNIGNLFAPGLLTDLGGGAYRITAGGAQPIGDGVGAGNNREEIGFAWMQVTGNFVFRARMADAIDNAEGSGWVRGGVMMRQTLDANSKMIAMLGSHNGMMRALVRDVADDFVSGPSTHIEGNPPRWLEIERAENVWTCRYALDVDGAPGAWVDFHTYEEVSGREFPGTVYVGLCANSEGELANYDAVEDSFTFDNLSLS